MRKKIKPIRPEDIAKAKRTIIPDEVIEAFNLLIAKHYNFGISTFSQDEVLALTIENFKITGKDNITYDQIFKNNWFDVESIFGRAGWKVEYDKSDKTGFNNATFTFKRKSI
jgi:hypothetical protein